MENLIEDLKLLIEVNDINDKLLIKFINGSIKSIKRYINNSKYSDDIIITEYDDVVLELAKRAYHSHKISNKNYGVKSKTQGQRSITYQDNLLESPYTITSDISKLLPGPFISVL